MGKFTAVLLALFLSVLVARSYQATVTRQTDLAGELANGRHFSLRFAGTRQPCRERF